MLELIDAHPLAADLPQGRGLAVTLVTGLGVATVQPHRGEEAATTASIAAALGLRLEDRPVRYSHGALAAMGIGPAKWLVTAEGEGNGLSRRLQDIVGGTAAVEDQSDAYVILRLAGPGCLPVLARGVNVDLHPAQFGVGAVAVTGIAHFGAILWRREDEVGAPVFELAAPRSMAGSLIHWLDASIAGAGLRPT